RDVRRDPRVAGPLVLLIAGSSLATAFALVWTGPPDAMGRVLEESGLPGGGGAVVAVVFLGVVAVAVLAPLSACLVAGLVWAWSTLRDGVSRYTVALVAILYVGLLSVVSTVAEAVATRATDRDVVGVTIGPALLVSPDEVSPYAYATLLHLDVFTLWWTALVALAAVHAMDLRPRDAVLLALALWLVGLGLVMTVPLVAGSGSAPTGLPSL
ncbi:MAG: hypothetical protein KY397_06470, partial [Gemmatimonadetes bacterium]|nr:hypothetical protein [Gemmatimonadota bacterium]